MRLWRLVFLVLVGSVQPARADWRVAETTHFVVHADMSENTLRRFAERLEKFDKALRIARGVDETPPPKAARVRVYMLGSSAKVASLIGNAHVAGAYIPRAGDSVAFVPEEAAGDFGNPSGITAEAVLFHEYAHHFMFTVWPDAALPSWVVEGWAEFNATAQVRKDGSILFGNAPNYRARGLLTGNPLPIEQLLAGAVGKLRTDQHAALYGRGWALVHYLTFEPSRKGQLGAYLDAITRQRRTPEQAAAAFGDLGVLHRELQQFLYRPRISGYTIRAELLTVPPVSVRLLGPGEAAMMPVRIQLERGVRSETAAALLAEATRIAAAFPADPAVQATLAQAAYEARDWNGALAAADRAIAADETMLEAHYHRALAQMAQAQAAGDMRPETWLAIRRTISRANRLDPDDPRPLALYYRSFADHRETPSALARDGLLRAFTLAPQDRGLRLQTAAMLIAQHKLAEAREMLLVLTYDPHASGIGERASRMIDAIDAQKARAKPAAAGGTGPAGSLGA
ncbi:hypothetical protein [Sphingomonas sp. R1]|uniref:hypothetical protein n=1 Tax=Sphingomonas sp. R1 TaxID=399176 RepID=UPI0022257736|nr:hypothetical protein [Sphingomonas sp. R1]UYY76583.1 hypothetical protein OIM94_13810 [Sphingomonas sp. R1]